MNGWQNLHNYRTAFESLLLKGKTSGNGWEPNGNGWEAGRNKWKIKKIIDPKFDLLILSPCGCHCVKAQVISFERNASNKLLFESF